jgi:cold shock CspA family protein
MTGRIEVLDTDNRPGFIRSEDGALVQFRLSEVTARQGNDLVVGQLVTFDVEQGNPPKAFSIKIEKRHYTSHGAEKRQQPVRYNGFEQSGNIRAYKFERLSPEGETQTAVVSTDLALFLKHRIGIQDGPALCLRLVTTEMNDARIDTQQPYLRTLTDEDMRAHTASRVVPEKRKHTTRANAANARARRHSWGSSGPRNGS